MLPGTERAVAKGDREARCTGPSDVWERVTDIRSRVAIRHVKCIVAINEHFNLLDAFLRERPTANHADAAVDPIVPRFVE